MAAKKAKAKPKALVRKLPPPLKKRAVKKVVRKPAAQKPKSVAIVAVKPRKAAALRVSSDGVVLNKRVLTTPEGVVIRVLED